MASAGAASCCSASRAQSSSAPLWLSMSIACCKASSAGVISPCALVERGKVDPAGIPGRLEFQRVPISVDCAALSRLLAGQVSDLQTVEVQRRIERHRLLRFLQRTVADAGVERCLCLIRAEQPSAKDQHADQAATAAGRLPRSGGSMRVRVSVTQ